MHGFHGRVLADVPVDGRRIAVSVRARRLVCPVLDCPRQTFREQAPMKEPTGDRRAPRYKPTLVDPYRDHLRRRRSEDPAVPVTHLLREIKELGYTGSANLLVRYITQGRAEGDKPVTTPQRFACLLLTRPENLRDTDTALLQDLAAACLEMTQLTRLTGEFVQLLTPAEGNYANLAAWITTVRVVDLPHLHSFTNGLELDRAAVEAGLTLPYHNGRTEGVNTRTKQIMRQMHGRTGSPLLRHRILLQ